MDESHEVVCLKIMFLQWSHLKQDNGLNGPKIGHNFFGK